MGWRDNRQKRNERRTGERKRARRVLSSSSPPSRAPHEDGLEKLGKGEPDISDSMATTGGGLGLNKSVLKVLNARDDRTYAHELPPSGDCVAFDTLDGARRYLKRKPERLIEMSERDEEMRRAHRLARLHDAGSSTRAPAAVAHLLAPATGEVVLSRPIEELLRENR